MMPKIPLYEQGRLASSVTGTPGVDGSLSAVFDGAAKGANAVTNEIAANARQNQIIAYQAQREQQAIAAAQKETLDAIDAANHFSQANLGLLDIGNRVRTEKQTDPTGADKVYHEQATTYLNSYLDKISDPDVKAKVQLKSMEAINSQSAELNGWALTQRTQNSQQNLITTLTGYVNAAQDFTGSKDVGAAWGQVDQLRGAMVLAYGPKADAIARKAKTQITKNFFEGLMIRDFNAVEAQIASGAYDSALSAKDQRELIYRANLYQKAKQQEDKQQYRLDAVAREIQTLSGVSSVDDDDVKSLIGRTEELRAEIAREQALPPEQQSVEHLGRMTSELTQREKQIKNFGKAQTTQKAAKASVVYADDEGVKARDKLDRQWFNLKGYLKGTPDDHINALEAYSREATKIRKEGYLTRKEHRAELDRVADEIARWKNKKPEETLSLFERFQTIGDQMDAAIENTRKILNQAPAKPGKPKAHRVDAGMVQYKNQLNGIVAKYKERHGKDPSPAVLARMKADAQRMAEDAHDRD